MPLAKFRQQANPISIGDLFGRAEGAEGAEEAEEAEAAEAAVGLRRIVVS